MRLRVPVLLALAAAASVAGCASEYGYDSYGQGYYGHDYGQGGYYGQGEYYGRGDYDHHRDRGDYNREYNRDPDGSR